VALAVAPGCGFVPTNRLSDCQKFNQTLHTENSQLKDVVLRLRSQNEELAQRALDDLDRLRTQEESIRRLERSVLAYQQERERMASALEQIRRESLARDDASPAPEPRGRR